MTRYTSRLIFSACLLFSLTVQAETQTYIRDYTYRASDLDSKISSRMIALEEVKRELLEELGTHIESIIEMREDEKGRFESKRDIVALSAGVTQVEILEEQWDGAAYYLKAKLQADPEDVLRAIDKYNEAKGTQETISVLEGSLEQAKQLLTENAETLKKAYEEKEAALAEMAKLRKGLAESKNKEDGVHLFIPKYSSLISQFEVIAWKEKGDMYARQNDYLQAIYWLEKAAEQGDTEAQLQIGAYYLFGEDVQQDYKKAFYWMDKAAMQGDALAQTALGQLYGNGWGVQWDNDKAFYWYEKAAMQDIAYAQSALGLIYDEGAALGIGRDVKKAAYWYEKAAMQGEMKAQYWIGRHYMGGIEKDVKKAVYWLEKAAEQGYAEAQAALGEFYDNGSEVHQDVKKAFYWRKKAAEQGDAESQAVIGLYYHYGFGVQQNDKEAVYWLEKAVKGGSINAPRWINEFYPSHGTAGSERNVLMG